jgi:hypothetical protein
MKPNFLQSFVLGVGLALWPGVSLAQKWPPIQCERILSAATPLTPPDSVNTVMLRDEFQIIADLKKISDTSDAEETEKLFREALSKLGFENVSIEESWEMLKKEKDTEWASPFEHSISFYTKNTSILIDRLQELFSKNLAWKFNTRIDRMNSDLLLKVYSHYGILWAYLIDEFNSNTLLANHVKKLHQWEISNAEFSVLLECHAEFLNWYVRDLHSQFPPSDTPKNWSILPEELKKFSHTLTLLKQEGLIYTIYDWKIYFFSSEWSYLAPIDINDTGLWVLLEKILEENKYVRLIEYIKALPQTNIDIWMGITHEESLGNIEVRKKFAQLFKQYWKNGFTFVVEEAHAEKFKILAVLGDKVVAEVQNENPHAFDFFFKTLSLHSQNATQGQSLGYKVNSASKKIDFVDSIYDEWIIKRKAYPSLFNILDIADTAGIGGQEGLSLALSIYSKLDNAGFSIYTDIFSKPNFYLPSWRNFFARYKVDFKDYWRIRDTYILYFFGLVNNVIQKNKDITPITLISFIEKIYLMDLSRGIKTHSTHENGIPMLIQYLLTNALGNNPKLFDSPEMQSYFASFPYLKDSLSTGQATRVANSRILDNSQWWTGIDLANSVKIRWEYDVFLRIRDMKINWVETMTEKEILELKLCIARNLAIQNIDDIEKFLIEFDNQRGWIVQEELRKILEQRSAIFPETIFYNKSIYHLAHYWQWVDAFGTPGTQKALIQQANSGKYLLFDAETIKWKRISEKWNQIQWFYNQFIEETNPAVFLAEWHANQNGFSILDDYTRTDKFEIIKENATSNTLDPAKLADIIIRRSKFRQSQKIEKNDIFIFAACKWDFVMNVILELSKRKNEYEKDWISPPVIIIAAEAGENSIFRSKEPIPYEILNFVLQIGGSELPTFGSFFHNQHSKQMGSNPWVFYPDKNWIYKQLF